MKNFKKVFPAILAALICSLWAGNVAWAQPPAVPSDLTKLGVAPQGELSVLQVPANSIGILRSTDEKNGQRLDTAAYPNLVTEASAKAMGLECLDEPRSRDGQKCELNGMVVITIPKGQALIASMGYWNKQYKIWEYRKGYFTYRTPLAGYVKATILLSYREEGKGACPYRFISTVKWVELKRAYPCWNPVIGEGCLVGLWIPSLPGICPPDIKYVPVPVPGPPAPCPPPTPCPPAPPIVVPPAPPIVVLPPISYDYSDVKACAEASASVIVYNTIGGGGTTNNRYPSYGSGGAIPGMSVWGEWTKYSIPTVRTVTPPVPPKGPNPYNPPPVPPVVQPTPTPTPVPTEDNPRDGSGDDVGANPYPPISTNY